MSTQRCPLPTCDPQLTLIVASKLPPFTSRRAIDSTGRLGSFYDACHDQALDKSDLNFIKKSAQSQKLPLCFIKRVKTDESSNLLELCNIHHELRLSVALQMVQEMGVGALINYSQPTNKYTRLICYDYYSHTDYMLDDEYNRLTENKIAMPNIHATHVIVLVNWGIDAVAVIQLPPDDGRIVELDNALKNLCHSLKHDDASVMLSENDKSLLEQVDPIEVFSNIPDLAKIKSIIDFHSDMPRVKNNINLMKPYNYSLCSIENFYFMNNSTQVIFNGLGRKYASEIEGYLLDFSRQFRKLKDAMDRSHPNLEQHLKRQFSEMHTSWSNLGGMHMHEFQRVKRLIIDVRRGEITRKVIPETLHTGTKKKLQESISDFVYKLNAKRKKELLIRHLLRKHFEYRNAVDYNIQHDDDEQIIAQKLFPDGNCHHAICFNDTLLQQNKIEWDQLNTQLIKEQKTNPQLHFIYVDFSYCAYELKDFIILPTIKKDINTAIPKPVSVLLERPVNDNTMNILLLGESGVGKSTFINAFVNYLLFDTLELAKNKSVVIIPVSFLITTGDDFQEQTVRFGGMDALNNEDHDHPGQSVTQHCRSYVFTLKDRENKGRKLRIIDTPGIGDVRGLAQDDINMQHILSYINNLSHLNAVCILMKPNNARLNILFRTCFMQLFDLLGENVSEKIIFCFTNARATFYTPGNTAPLLKTMLQSLRVKQIPFTKSNTFCFDSESFRYLVAIQNGVEFGESEGMEYRDSWQKSSTESKRFIEHIYVALAAPLSPSQTKSVKDVQLKISMMIRPMVETMRNILRNIVLSNGEFPSISIELCPKSITEPKAICFTCSRQSLQVHNFLIRDDASHLFDNKCRSCSCGPQEHYPIDYKLEYEVSEYPGDTSKSDLTTMLDKLCQTSAEFAHFLVQTTGASQNDLFLVGMERMIREEEDICTKETSNQLNLKLLDCLKPLKQNYEKIKAKLLTEKQQIPLSDVYKKIEQMNKYDMIKCQVTAAEEWHKFMIKYYEYEVPT